MQKSILVFGDSNLWGGVIDPKDAPYLGATRWAREERFAGILQQILGDDYFVIEDALPGRMSMMDDPLNALRTGYPQLQTALEVHHPVDLLILHLGTNELRHMLNMSAEMIACSAGRLVSAAKSSVYSAKRVLVLAPHPMAPNVDKLAFGFLFGSDAYGKSLGFSKAFSAMADGENVYFLDCASLDFELNLYDGIHYSKSDVRKLAEAVCEKIKAIFG